MLERKKILVTGAYGFIGSHLAADLIKKGHDVHILDAQTYAANPEGLRRLIGGGKLIKAYHFDLRDSEIINRVIQEGQFNTVYHLAAESHVCNSIKGPRLFYETNVMGTLNLVESIRKHSSFTRLVHVSTDEVFGDLADTGKKSFNEKTPVNPKSPYSSSKAASDHVVMSYAHTFGLNAVVTNCSNNYGPNQHEEKLIPATIKRLIKGEPIRLYGDGTQIRDWLWVKDHCEALQVIADNGVPGERYCIGSDCPMSNKEMVEHIRDYMLKENFISSHSGIKFTNDRPTDDKIYRVNSSKTQSLGWYPSSNLPGLTETIKWYIDESN